MVTVNYYKSSIIRSYIIITPLPDHETNREVEKLKRTEKRLKKEVAKLSSLCDSLIGNETLTEGQGRRESPVNTNQIFTSLELIRDQLTSVRQANVKLQTEVRTLKDAAANLESEVKSVLGEFFHLFSYLLLLFN